MKILVADDDEDTAQSFKMLLQLAGHEVCSAADGQQAVDLAKTFQPAVALLDIGMPHVDGYEAASIIRAMLPDALLVAVTGWPNRGGKDAFREFGFDYYLMKPIDSLALCQLLSSRLERRSRSADGRSGRRLRAPLKHRMPQA